MLIHLCILYPPDKDDVRLLQNITLGAIIALFAVGATYLLVRSCPGFEMVWYFWHSVRWRAFTKTWGGLENKCLLRQLLGQYHHRCR